MIPGLSGVPASGRRLWRPAMHRCRDISRPGLGALFLSGATTRAVLASLGLAVALSVVLVGLVATAWACLFGAGIVWGLARLARANGAINGDFIGAAVVAVELAACLAGLI